MNRREQIIRIAFRLDTTSSTKMSKVMSACNNSSDNNGLLTTNL